MWGGGDAIVQGRKSVFLQTDVIMEVCETLSDTLCTDIHCYFSHVCMRSIQCGTVYNTKLTFFCSISSFSVFNVTHKLTTHLFCAYRHAVSFL